MASCSPANGQRRSSAPLTISSGRGAMSGSEKGASYNCNIPGQAQDGRGTVGLGEDWNSLQTRKDMTMGQAGHDPLRTSTRREAQHSRQPQRQPDIMPPTSTTLQRWRRSAPATPLHPGSCTALQSENHCGNDVWVSRTSTSHASTTNKSGRYHSVYP